MEQAGINNHHAAGEIVKRMRRHGGGGAGSAIWKGSIAAAVLALVGLAVLPFVRERAVAPEVEHVFQPKGRKRAIEDQTNRDFARFGR